MNPVLDEHLKIVPNRTKPRKSVRPIHSVWRRLSPDDLATLIADYKHGVTAAELGQRYKVSKSSVIKLLRAEGVTIRRPRIKPREMAKIAKLYQAGIPQAEIAKQLDRSPSAIWHALRRAGIVGRK